MQAVHGSLTTAWIQAISSIPAHAFHCFQLASNSALASSSVATWGRAD